VKKTKSKGGGGCQTDGRSVGPQQQEVESKRRGRDKVSVLRSQLRKVKGDYIPKS